MSTPLAAGGRITLPYVVSGFTHKLRVFVRNPQAVGGSYNINSRPVDANDIVWTDALNDLATALSWAMPAGFSYVDGTLEKYTGGVYTPLATATPTFTNHAAGTVQQGWQLTWVARDINLKKVKLVVLEGNASTFAHYVTLAAAVALNASSFIKEFTSAHLLTNAPYTWAVGRGNQYLNTSPFVGLTICGNRRVRRRRGLT